jgi:hypothetical protein
LKLRVVRWSGLSLATTAPRDTRQPSRKAHSQALSPGHLASFQTDTIAHYSFAYQPALTGRSPAPTQNHCSFLIAHYSFVHKPAPRTTLQPACKAHPSAPSPSRLASFPSFAHSKAISPGRLPSPHSKPLLTAHSYTTSLSRTTPQHPRHWIASLALAMTTPQTTHQPSRLHSLHSLIARQTRQPPLKTIAHCSFLIAHSSTSPLPQPTRQPSRLHSYTSPLPGTTRNPKIDTPAHYSFVYQSSRKADSPACSPLDCFANTRRARASCQHDGSGALLRKRTAVVRRKKSVNLFQDLTKLVGGRHTTNMFFRSKKK